MKLAVDYHDDDAVVSFTEENFGRWADGLEPPTALQLRMRLQKSLVRTSTKMFILGDSILNLYKTRDGPETEAAKEAAGYGAKNSRGNPKSLFIRHRSAEEKN